MYTLKNDLVFKNVFFKDLNKLKWLLDGIFSLQGISNIEIYNISNNELGKDRLYIKNKVVDSIIDTNYAYINMELNDKFNEYKKIRNFFYQTSYLNSLVHVNGDYTCLEKPIIQINLNIKNKIENELLNKYSINNSITYNEYLNIFYIININIDKMLDKWYNELNQDINYFNKYKYVLILGMDEDELMNLEVEDKMINEIKDEVITLNRRPEFYQVISREEDNRMMMKTSFIEGEQAGMKAGIEKNNNDTARKMKKKKLSFELISEITGLDINTIKNL